MLRETKVIKLTTCLAGDGVVVCVDTKSKRGRPYVVHFSSSKCVHSYSLEQIKNKCHIKSVAEDSRGCGVPETMSEREMLQAIMLQLQILGRGDSPSMSPASNLCNGFEDQEDGLPPPPVPSAELSPDTPPAPTAPRLTGLPRPIARKRPERVESPSADMTSHNALAPLPIPTDASYVRACVA